MAARLRHSETFSDSLYNRFSGESVGERNLEHCCMDELIEADSDNDKVRGKYLWNSVGCRRLLNSCRDEDSALQSSHLSYT